MSFFSATTRMPAGVTNAAPWQTLGNYGAPDPTWYHQYANDFDVFATGDWTTTVVGSGAAALVAGYDGGGLALTTSVGAADAVYLQLVQAGFKLAAGKEVFFKFAGQLSVDLLQSIAVGLMVKTTTPLAGNPDGVYITKGSNGALNLATAVGGVTTLTPLGFTPAVATDFEVGFHIDTQGNVEAFYNPTTGNNPISAAAGVPRGRVAALQAPSLPAAATALVPTVAILNGSGVIRALTADYIVAARAR